MSLTPGTRLGAFEVAALIGAGGMGEVYRARDSRLNRDVAIKILPEQFVADPDRLARFQREAHLLASLNHPNIASIYGVEDAGGQRALVLELVEGPTLADRIAQGPVPIDETIVIARQICDALEAAHDRGIIHRDLKPANIKLTQDGSVKVLDFGLAKALDPAGDISPMSPGLLSQSPTLTSPAMTHMGVILGTAGYMSPEQAKGRPADKRSDIWAFGCVFYEMLTGKRAFDGEDLTEMVAAIVRGDPDWKALPGDLPRHVRTLLEECLRKDRKARMPDIGVARFLLDRGTELGAASAAASVSRVTAWQRLRIVALAAATLLVAAMLATVIIVWASSRPARSGAPLRFTADIGADASIVTGISASTALSPDGTIFAFVANKSLGDIPSLYVRRLNQLRASALPGTDGAANPFFSPDGQWIGFFAQGKLKKVSVTGGAPVTLCQAISGRGGSWTEDGSIIFAPDTVPGTALSRVSSEGGTPSKLFDLAENERIQRWPQVLPGGAAVLFTSTPGAGGYDNADLVVQSLTGGSRKILVHGGYFGRYLRSGHLTYVHEGTIFAVPFDLDRLELTGGAVPVIEGASASPNGGATQLAISDVGIAAYLPGESLVNVAPIRWLDKTGKLTVLRSVASDWSNPSVSPDGTKLAIDIVDSGQADVWIYDWQRDALSRFTFDPADDVRPIWTPDGQRIIFSSKRGDKSTTNLYWQRADGTGEVQRLTDSKNPQFASSIHPSGKFVTFSENMPGSASDLMVLPLDGDEHGGWKAGAPQIFLKTPQGESSGMFSADGRWLAYLSNESGRNEVCVRPFPGPGGKWQISTGGADDPTWSRVAPELFFVSVADLRLMVARYRAEGASFISDKPVVWADARLAARPRSPSRDLDIHPDGRRFVVSANDEGLTTKENKVVFVFNFFDELRRVAPPRK